MGERVFGKAVKGRSSAHGWCRAYIDHESSDVHFPTLFVMATAWPRKRASSRHLVIGNHMVIADRSGRTGVL